jgi:hypothetical protein
MRATFTGTLLVSLTAAFSATPALAAEKSGFEGVVTYSLSLGPAAGRMKTTLLLKGSRSRTETEVSPGRRAVVIMDVASGTVMSVDDTLKTYTVTRMDAPDRGAAGPRPPAFTRTGKVETVAGRRCEHYLDADTALDICAASGMGYFAAGAGAPAAPAWDELRTAFPDGFFPLKMESTRARAVIMEVERIEPQALPDTLFSPPAGYKEFKLR